MQYEKISRGTVTEMKATGLPDYFCKSRIVGQQVYRPEGKKWRGREYQAHEKIEKEWKDLTYS